MNTDDLIALLRRLGETHRPVVRPYPDSDAHDLYSVQCPACDGNQWRNWQQGDPPVECEFWRDYNAMWVTQ